MSQPPTGADLTRRALLVGLSSAALAPPALAANPRRAYRKAWKAQTRKLVVYKEFGTALLLRATLLEPGFRAALADERHRLLGSADTGDALFRARMLEHGSAYHEVVFAADSGEERDPLFGNNDARWNLRLRVDGTEAPLVTVERVRRPTPVHQGLYLQLDIWSELWIARFERVKANPSEVILAVGSGLGNGEVRW